MLHNGLLSGDGVEGDDHVAVLAPADSEEGVVVVFGDEEVEGALFEGVELDLEVGFVAVVEFELLPGFVLLLGGVVLWSGRGGKGYFGRRSTRTGRGRGR